MRHEMTVQYQGLKNLKYEDSLDTTKSVFMDGSTKSSLQDHMRTTQYTTEMAHIVRYVAGHQVTLRGDLTLQDLAS
ncbi:MAG: hypothetical protein Q9182_000018 [Xanthomendoza sp. 2 TL-2023]